MLEIVWKHHNKKLKLIVVFSQYKSIFSLVSLLTTWPILWVTRIRFLSDLPGMVRELESITCT